MSTVRDTSSNTHITSHTPDPEESVLSLAVTESGVSGASDNIQLSPLEITLIAVILGGVVILLGAFIVWYCCRRKRRERAKMAARRDHQPLCAVDSGAVSVSINRLSGAPQNQLLRQISGGTPQGTPRSSLKRDGPRMVSIQRDGSRVSSLLELRGSHLIREDARPSQKSRYSPRSVRCSTMTGQDGFTLSSSFEGGLDLHGSQYDNLERPKQSKLQGSQYDSLEGEKRSNLLGSQYDNLDEPVNLDRKGSTYDNIDKDAKNPLTKCDLLSDKDEPTAGCNSNNVAPTRTSAYQKRKSSKTLPLNFNLFNATKYGRAHNTDSDEDPDYANVPKKPRSSKLSQDKEKRSSTPEGMVDKSGNPVAAPQKSKKYRARRGSKTLELFINRKVPPVLTKIQRQVLEAVPIFGEPTPGTTPKSAPLDDMQFPPPPKSTPPTSPVLSYINPMYSPTTATPGTANSSGAYFSV